MAGSSEPAFLFLGIKMELLLHRLLIYFATAPVLFYYVYTVNSLILFVLFLCVMVINLCKFNFHKFYYFVYL